METGKGSSDSESENFIVALIGEGSENALSILRLAEELEANVGELSTIQEALTARDMDEE